MTGTGRKVHFVFIRLKASVGNQVIPTNNTEYSTICEINRYLTTYFTLREQIDKL
jgi:hypothetical protein